ncbi:MAG: HIT family protein [Oscillospiraceae bacterium]|nr:HIT family protein [Oscillospiraceae bacterium]
MSECMVCDRIELTKAGKNPYFVRELETGYVVIGDYQRFYGYTVFICKQHASELFQLENDFKMKYLEEMSLVAECVYKAFPCDKIHYELLGVGSGVHMHWHIFPRREGDSPVKGPVWKVPKEEMYSEKYKPSTEQLAEMKEILGKELDKVFN